MGEKLSALRSRIPSAMDAKYVVVGAPHFMHLWSSSENVSSSTAAHSVHRTSRIRRDISSPPVRGVRAESLCPAGSGAWCPGEPVGLHLLPEQVRQEAPAQDHPLHMQVHPRPRWKGAGARLLPHGRRSLSPRPPGRAAPQGSGGGRSPPPCAG